jgi:hypothetical protein
VNAVPYLPKQENILRWILLMFIKAVGRDRDCWGIEVENKNNCLLPMRYCQKGRNSRFES